MKTKLLTIALLCGQIIYAQNKPLTVRFMPTFSVAKSKGSEKNVQIGNGGYSEKQKTSSKKIKTKSVIKFGEFAVSDVSFNNEEVEVSASYFLKYVNSKIVSNSYFTVNHGTRQAVVKSSDNIKVEGIGSSSWTDLIIPFKARLVNVGIIKIDSLKWEYFVEDKNFINNSTEEVVGYLTNGTNKITIKLFKRVLSFYDGDSKVGELVFPIFKETTIWLAENTDESTQLAISSVCSSVLFKVKGTNQTD